MIANGMGATETGEGQTEADTPAVALEVEQAEGPDAGVPVIEISEAEAREFGIDLSGETKAPEALAEGTTSGSVAVEAADAPPDSGLQELRDALDAAEEKSETLEKRVKEFDDKCKKLEEKNKSLDEKSKSSYERLVRTTADLDNLKKRTRREVEDAKNESKGKVIREVLPILDNLERAMAHAGTVGGEDSKGLRAGIELVQRQFVQALERCGVKSVEVLHTQFDPNMHEAVGQKETADHPPGTVIEVFQRGYMLGERLVRPALVVVSRAVTTRPVEAVPVPEPSAADSVPIEVEAAIDGTLPTEQIDADALATADVPPEEGASASNGEIEVSPPVVQPSQLAEAAATQADRPRSSTIPYSGAPTDEASKDDTSEGENE